MDVFAIFDIVFILCGAYFIFGAIKMKKTGVPNMNLLGNKADVSKIKDAPALISYVFPRMIIMGIIIIINGVGELVIAVLQLNPLVDSLLSLFLMACLLYYIMMIKTIRTEYMRK